LQLDGFGFALAFTGGRVEMEATGDRRRLSRRGGQPSPHRGFHGRERRAQGDPPGSGRHTYSLFEGGAPGEHVLRVVKRTENSKGRMGIHRLTLAGEARAPTAARAAPPAGIRWRFHHLGFGNDMRPDETAFSPEKEDGLTAYPAVAAKLLDAEYQSLCISGIPLCWAIRPRLPHPACPSSRISRRRRAPWRSFTPTRIATIRRPKA
jgi:hypothetical protein